MNSRRRELLGQLQVLTIVLWTILLVDASSLTPFGRISGLLLGTDFVQFYAAAAAAHDGKLSEATTTAGLREYQVRTVPASHASLFPPVYPPQVALVLWPLGAVGYRTAYSIWVVVSLLLYALGVRWCYTTAPSLRPWKSHVGWAAAAFPALWFLVLHGQLSAVALASLALATRAIGTRRPWLAGAALGLLAYKPTLFVPVVATLALAGDWRTALATIAAGALQFVAALPIAGAEVLVSYVTTILQLARTPDLVASNPVLMHSLRTMWSTLLPTTPAVACYIVSAAAVLIIAARVWRTSVDALHRIGTLALAIVLVSPHMFVYDLVVLVPAFAAAATCLSDEPGTRRGLKNWTLAAFFAGIWGIPASVIAFQASTVAFLGMFLALSARVLPTCNLRSSIAAIPRSR
jgi:hypothetical protein